MPLNKRFWTLLDRSGPGDRAARDWKLHLGARWMDAAIHRTATIAINLEGHDGSRLDVREEDGSFVLLAEDSIRGDSVPRGDVELWKLDWRRMAAELAEAHEFNECEPDGSGDTRRIGIFHSSKSPRRDVYLHLSYWHFGARESLLRDLSRLQDCILFLTSEDRALPEVHALAKSRGIVIQPVLGKSGLANLHTTTASQRAGKAPRSLPVFSVRKDWKWTALKVEAHVDHMKLRYGMKSAKHSFRKSNNSKMSKSHEILLWMARKGSYEFGTSEGHSIDADRRAMQRLAREMKDLVPIEGEPFILDHEEARPVFDVVLPKGIRPDQSPRRGSEEFEVA